MNVVEEGNFCGEGRKVVSNFFERSALWLEAGRPEELPLQEATIGHRIRLEVLGDLKVLTILRTNMHISTHISNWDLRPTSRAHLLLYQRTQ